MTNGAVGNDMLCEKLRARFEYRGVNNPAVKNRVSLQKENEKKRKIAIAENEKRAKEYRDSRIEPGFTSAKQRLPGREYSRRVIDSFEAERHDFIPDGGRFGLAFEKGAAIRSRAEAFNVKAYERRNPSVVKRSKKEAAKTAPKKSFKSVMGEKIASLMPKREDTKPEDGERVIKRNPIPKGVVAGILVCTVLVMIVIYTFATYTQVVSDGKALENERTALMVERGRLINLLEVRDDVREIEDYATNTIGMVKSDLVESRYVSIAGGERIEVIKADEPEEGGFFSNILSAMGTNWDKLLEYLD